MSLEIMCVFGLKKCQEYVCFSGSRRPRRADHKRQTFAKQHWFGDARTSFIRLFNQRKYWVWREFAGEHNAAFPGDRRSCEKSKRAQFHNELAASMVHELFFIPRILTDILYDFRTGSLHGILKEKK